MRVGSGVILFQLAGFLTSALADFYFAKHNVREKLRIDEKRGAILPGKPELLAPMFTGALIHLAKWWVLEDWKTPKDEIVRECAEVLKLV